MAVIGLDFGNFNSFMCYISDFDSETRMGGIVHDLLPGEYSHGIPSVFFFSKSLGILCGEDAVRSRARPAENRVRYLKRNLDKTMVLDEKEISYDSAITAVIQHCVRRANEQLQAGWQITTNQVSLSYPAAYTYAQRQRLIELAGKATLADGTPLQVYGTIAEPAAAALDYLAEFAKETQETTVLVYDLGGGTFDLALVSAYPKGRKNRGGKLYYYDIINTRGLAKVGGAEFSEILFGLLSRKLPVPLSPALEMKLREQTESVKLDLSSDLYAEAELVYNDEYLSAGVTREEFEAASRDLLMQTIQATGELLRSHPDQQPEFILLTGGASQMPMVQRELEAAFPEFKGRIRSFRPSRAIAYGAARFGIAEEGNDVGGQNPWVQKRTMYDLGVRFYYSDEDQKGYIQKYIPAGTPIPFETDYRTSQTMCENQRYSSFQVYEARKENPDPEKLEDYTEIMSVTIDHGGEVPAGTKNETRLVVDRLEILTIQAREKNHTDKAPLACTCTLKNLS